MKKIHLIIILLLLAFNAMFIGCKDLLDETNIRVPVADVYYKTPEGIEDLSNSCYTYSRTFYGYRCWRMNILGTDLWLNGGDGPKYLGYYTLTADDATLWEVWESAYLGITSCNTLIGRINEVEGLTQDQLNNYLGQAYFLRALYYHILVINWGGVPLQLEEVQEPVTTATRASEEEVYAQIISDLLQAEQLLPVSQNDYGRATKPAAQALLARVYLWAEQYQNASTYAKKVINDYNFELLDNFADIFDYQNEKNAEVIWSVQFTMDELLKGTGNQGNSLFLARYDMYKGMIRTGELGRPFRHFMPTRYFLDLMASNLENDSRFEKSFTHVWYANNSNTLLPEMTIGDTAVYIPPFAVSQARKTATKNKYTTLDINDYYDETSPNGESPKGAREKFPSLNKFHDKSLTYNVYVGHQDYIVIRLAEMYLIAAEALMEQNKSDEGVTYINAVRSRAAKPGKVDAMKLTASQLTIDKILEERAIELAGECVGRWPDLKRTGKLLERVSLYNPDARPLLQEKHLLRPIPQKMIDRISNKEEFEQNPGY